MKSSRWLLALTLLVVAGEIPARERDRPFVDEQSAPIDVEEPKFWREGKTGQLPPFPAAEDLVEFQVDEPHRQFQYFLDGRHLSVGKDGVVRYTLVVQSRNGVRNASFEGMRCGAQEYKVYAYDDGHGEFKALKSPYWQHIDRVGSDAYHRELWDYYLCVPRQFVPRRVKEIVDAARGAGDIQDGGFFQ